MADDLKLAVVIEALLNAKGFEDAKSALRTAADTAKKAGDEQGRAGDRAKKMGESFGGSRGPVADLTRVLLLNTGVTGAAGEAAKAAGTAMYFFEGATGAAAVATSAFVAAVALGLPLLINYLTKSKDLADSSHGVASALDDDAESARKIADAFQQASAAANDLVVALHAQSMETERQKLARMREEVETYTKNMQKLGQVTDDSAHIVALRQQIALMEQAHQQGKTYAETVEEMGRVSKIASVDVSDLNAALKDQAESRARGAAFAAQQEIDAADDIRKFTEKTDKAKAKAAADETERILALQALKRAADAQDAAAAAAHADNVRQAAAVSTQAFAGLVAAFTKNKALNIAAAIGDTFAAANVALKSAPPPLNFALMAAVIAQGIANVHRIRTANPEGIGFDDPFADMTASMLGRRSAKDFARHFGREFVGALPGEMDRQTVNHYSTRIDRSVTHNYGGISGLLATSPTAFERGLERVRVRSDRFRSRTTLGR